MKRGFDPEEKRILFAALVTATVCLTLAESLPAQSKRATVVKTVDGIDWSLPDYVRLTPFSGYIAGGRWARQRMQLPRFQDGKMHFAGHAAVTWRQLNPAEGVYNWALLDRIFGPRDPHPTTGVSFYVRAYSARRNPPDLPDWVITKGEVKSLANGAVAAWDPNCRYEEYYGKLLKAIGDRYRDHPRLIGFEMRGLDHLYGEWCWRGSRSDLKEAEERTGLTPETFRAWGMRFVDDYVEAFRGQEQKLVWQNGEETFIPSYGWHCDYGPASRDIWRHAYQSGCGGRDGMPTVWYRYLNAGYGENLTDAGYLEFDDNFAPVKNGCLWYTENTEYFADNETWNKERVRFGTEKDFATRWFTTTMRVLQMRRNWMNVRSQVMPKLEATDPDFLRWVEYSLGKTPETSPDAWCWLREGYLARWTKERPVRNFERWLLERDVEPGGRTLPAEKIDISALRYNYASGKGYEYHARRTDLAGGNRRIWFRVDPAFAAGLQRLLLKITYLDGPATEWCVDYDDGREQTSSDSVATNQSGKWKTVTFDVRKMQLGGPMPHGMDFCIHVLGNTDLTVKLVRLIKPEPK